MKTEHFSILFSYTLLSFLIRMSVSKGHILTLVKTCNYCNSWLNMLYFI